MQTKNRIESIVHRLQEVGAPILDLSVSIKQQSAIIAGLRAQIEQAEQWQERDRQNLLAMVRRNYTDSEIEAADVMVNRAG